MTALLIILHVIVCLILIFVILVQGGRGQGLTGPTFASGNVQSLFGTRAADFLTKATSVAAICFIFTCIGLNFVETQKSRSLMGRTGKRAPVDMETIKKILEKVKKEKSQNPVPSGQPAASAAASSPQAATPPAQKNLPAQPIKTPDANAAKN